MEGLESLDDVSVHPTAHLHERRLQVLRVGLPSQLDLVRVLVISSQEEVVRLLESITLAFIETFDLFELFGPLGAHLLATLYHCRRLISARRQMDVEGPLAVYRHHVVHVQVLLVAAKH